MLFNLLDPKKYPNVKTEKPELITVKNDLKKRLEAWMVQQKDGELGKFRNHSYI